MLHFAYGSNMSRAVMRRHAPDAQPVGIAVLRDYRFFITIDGYASIAPRRTQAVHGVLWRLTPRDRVTLDLWENVAGGQYQAKTLRVRVEDRLRPALTYVGRRSRVGLPKAGYMEVVVAAAGAWELPPDYIALLQHWLPNSPRGAGTRRLGDF